MTKPLSAAIAALDHDLARASAPCDHPVLPEGMQRGDLNALLRAVRARLGLNADQCDALLAMIERTRPSDWTSPADEPVCFAKQDSLAATLGKDGRSIRRYERLFEKMGFIEIRTLGNGARRRSGAHGLVFSPLIARIATLLDLRDQLAAERSAIETIVCRRSCVSRHMRARLAEIVAVLGSNPAIEDLRDQLAAFPRTDAIRRMSLDAAEAHLAEVRDLAHRIETIAETHPNMSGQPDTGVRSHIQDTTNDSHEVCSAGAHERPAGKPADDDHATSALRADKGKEYKRAGRPEERNPEWVAFLDPSYLRRLASPDMQLYLDGLVQGSRPPRLIDLTEAAILRLPELGINPTAWEEATATMGQGIATVAVLVIDANRDHPTSPVRSPGGMLRDLTRRHRVGDLNLVGSIKGLDARRRS